MTNVNLASGITQLVRDVTVMDTQTFVTQKRVSVLDAETIQVVLPVKSVNEDSMVTHSLKSISHVVLVHVQEFQEVGCLMQTLVTSILKPRILSVDVCLAM